ncbi:MAG: hypothetical protein Q9164_002799 [Protoblastenia rupestris]
MPAHATYETSYHQVSRTPRSPQSSRRSSPPRRTTLPPISDLFGPNIRHGGTDAGPRQDHGQSRAYSPLLSQSTRGSTQSILLTRPLEDRCRNQGQSAGTSLSTRSGPPIDQYRSSPSANGWSTTSLSAASNCSHSVPPPPQNSNASSAYPLPGMQSPYEKYDRAGGSSLPPPPPSRLASDNYQTADPYPRINSDRRGSYDSSPQLDRPLRSSQNYNVPPPPTNGYHAPSPYPAHCRTEQGSSYVDRTPDEYHLQAPLEYSSHSSPSYDAMEERPRRRRGNLPKWATDCLKHWFFDHIAHPYPTEQEKQDLCKVTGLGMTQLSNWFINARRRQTPALNAQAQAENMIRESSGQSRSRSDSDGPVHNSDHDRNGNHRGYATSNR